MNRPLNCFNYYNFIILCFKINFKRIKKYNDFMHKLLLVEQKRNTLLHITLTLTLEFHQTMRNLALA